MLEAEKFWNDRFDTSDFIFGTQPNKFLQQRSELYLTQPSHILCVADGEGRNSVWLAKQGHRVDAFDVSTVALTKAKKFALDAQVQVDFVHADCDSYFWSQNKYDAVAAIFIQFADPELRSRIFQNALISLKRGGLLIVQGYTPKQLSYKTGGPCELSYLYTEELMQDLLKEAHIIELESYEEELQEGKRHSGMSALLGLVARKK
jgi:2-polyprenyl-3-methyl-5-hydroxy-6-metoxy-1,4-benzoquinol methylase